MRRYEHKGGQKRTKEDVEVTKLCSRKIVFSDKNDKYPKADFCNDEQCQLCNTESLDDSQQLNLLSIVECARTKRMIAEVEAPTTAAVELLPSIQRIDDNYFSHAKNVNKTGDHEKDAAIKRLRMEEDKLKKVKHTKHCLEFINKYNKGMVSNAWSIPRRKKSM